MSRAIRFLGRLYLLAALLVAPPVLVVGGAYWAWREVRREKIIGELEILYYARALRDGVEWERRLSPGREELWYLAAALKRRGFDPELSSSPVVVHKEK